MFVKNSLLGRVMSKGSATLTIAAIVASIFMPAVSFAAASVSIVSINGEPYTGHCVAGPLTLVVNGQVGGQGGPYSIDVGDGHSTTTTAIGQFNKDDIFTNVTLNQYTPTQGGNSIIVYLYHSQSKGKDTSLVVINQCVAAPTEGVVVVTKQVINDNGGALSPSNFNLHLGSNNFPGDSNGTDILLSAGTYTLSEDSVSGYTGTISGDCALNGSITVVAGQNYACTITNNDNFVPVNTAPVLSPIGNKTVDELVNLSFNASATDAESNPLTYSMTGTPAGASFNTLSGAFSWTPTESQGPGVYPVTVTVSDGSLTDSETFNINVNEVNTSPILDAIGNKTIAENSLLTFSVTGSDTDLPANTLSFSMVGGPAGASFNTFTGLFSWTPGYSDSGTYTPVTFGISDGTTTVTENITINVTNTNRPPVLNAIGNQNGQEGSLTTFTVSGSDPDNDSVTLSISFLPSNASFDSNTGVFSWTPDNSQSGNYQITFTITDSNGAQDSETVTINVGNFNQSPALGALTDQVIPELTALNLTATATDGDNDPLVFSLTNAPVGMTISSSTGVFTWTPAEDQGPNVYPVTVEVSDGQISDTFVVNFTVAEVNTAPVATDDTDSTNEDTALVIPVANLLSNDTDSDLPANTLSVSSVQNPVNGTVVLSGSNVTFTPNTNYFGSASFEYTLSDAAATDTGLVNVTVNSVNDLPVITLTGASTLNLTVGDTYTELGATADDTEDGTGLTVTNINSSSVQMNTVGTYIVTYDFTDSNGGAATQVIRTVNVSAIPDTTAPVITLLGNNPVNVNIGDSYVDAGATANDNVDGDITSQIIVNNPVNTSVLGTYTVTYDVTDAAGNSATQVTRIVNVVNPVPQCRDGIDNDNDGLGDMADPGCDSTNDNDETGGTVTPPGGGGGGGGGGNGPVGGGFAGSSGGSVLGASTGPTGQVLGVSIEMCSQYLTAYIHPSRKNDSDQVSRLQRFLRDVEGFTNVSETGTYDQVSIDAVNAFQLRYAGDILSPWGASRPTSYVYYTTQKKINEAVCKFAREFPLTEQQIAEIERVKALGQSTNRVDNTSTTPVPAIEKKEINEEVPVVGGVESKDLTASVVESSSEQPKKESGFFKTLWNKVFGN